MKALRRIATPASVLVLSGCTYPFDDYLPQSSAVMTNDAGSDVRDSAIADTHLSEAGLADSQHEDSGVDDTFVPDTFVADSFVPDTFVPDTRVEDSFVADTHTATDTKPPCVCLKWAGPMCKDWSPAGCGD